ncbi:hypothetical protein BXZ70DRAFT_735061 [Cristinia sonorae]|uniref:Microbial-type PARG catalytic domain-containing protein n=1 Tax=Cristinia sonorae TaxID=1940300 RepID=A0A8K0UUC2_9AGAR|nr:hypothetical protein BXZ70DRAFT_735061 [Cristinia sonorae]
MSSPGSRQQGERRQHEDPKRAARRRIAESTLEAIERGTYLDVDIKDDIATSKRNTRFYHPDTLLSSWASSQPPTPALPNKVTLVEISTLEGARLLSGTHSDDAQRKIGVLNFASALRVGGGFRSGAQAQEESLARSSTLYASLTTATAQQFYTLHNRNTKGGYYSHAMVYSPGVVVMKNDAGDWELPLKVDVLTSAAVNAGAARQTLWGRTAGAKEEVKIEAAMRERMARILYLFENQGAKDVVLGSFGTGVFRNDVGTVAQIWADLLFVPGARFAGSFENVVFAILGTSTFETFREVFAQYGHG